MAIRFPPPSGQVPGFAAVILNLFLTFEAQKGEDMPVWQQDYARGLEMELSATEM